MTGMIITFSTNFLTMKENSREQLGEGWFSLGHGMSEEIMRNVIWKKKKRFKLEETNRVSSSCTLKCRKNFILITLLVISSLLV